MNVQLRRPNLPRWIFAHPIKQTKMRQTNKRKINEASGWNSTKCNKNIFCIRLQGIRTVSPRSWQFADASKRTFSYVGQIYLAEFLHAQSNRRRRRRTPSPLPHRTLHTGRLLEKVCLDIVHWWSSSNWTELARLVSVCRALVNEGGLGKNFSSLFDSQGTYFQTLVINWTSKWFRKVQSPSFSNPLGFQSKTATCIFGT